MSPPPRRTQKMRREGTIKKLVAAATDALIEDGYSGASVAAIATRAGVSQGGLFRHFATREALMVAVGEDVGEKLLARFRRQFARLDSGGDRVEAGLELLREHCRSRLNQAWYELSMASRTDAALRSALRPFAARYHREIETLARELFPELAERYGDRFAVVVDTVIAMFDGEVVHRFVVRRPELEAERLRFVAALLG